MFEQGALNPMLGFSFDCLNFSSAMGRESQRNQTII